MSRNDVRFARSRWALAAISCLGVVLFTIPGHLGLWQLYPFTQLSSMRMLTALGIAAGAICCLLWAVRARRGSLLRPSLVTALVCLVCVAVVGTSLVRDGALRSSQGDDAGMHDLVVMSFNASETSADDIADAIRAQDADVTMLVEAPAAIVTEVSEQVEGTTAFTNEDFASNRFESVGIVVQNRLGTYEQVDGPDLQLGSVAIEGGGHGPAHLTAVHPPPPVQRWAPAAHWRNQVRTSVEWCEDHEEAIVAGDFNAIADHLNRSGLDRCRSATDDLGLSAHGTWPVKLPGWLGAGIDHQLSDPLTWTPLTAKIITLGDSDHRAVVVTYRRA
ncbi:endonuclease/exonuclease/phosphatase family protein [Aeromicrobium sp. CTD01-1L150]|uniref:endonuclease/exonuclease/phosphatase family protein n=1 Tax=Aeromicrobium sp. CTD01-1L150 TaxID=3341830 RepID=UPI0035C0DEF8